MRVRYFFAFAALVTAASSEPVRSGKVSAELVSTQASIQPGQPLLVALRLVADPTWHTYWKNPGDSGRATSIKWDLPEGFAVTDLQFPVPKKFDGAGLVGFGYEGEVFLLASITPPKEWTGKKVDLKATASWLACDASQCLPGKAELTLTLPVRAGRAAATKWSSKVLEAFKQTPQRMPAGSRVSIARDGKNWRITLKLPKEHLGFPSSPQFFPETPDFADLSIPPEIVDIEGGLQIRVPVSPHVGDLKNPVTFVLGGLKQPLRLGATAPLPGNPEK